MIHLSVLEANPALKVVHSSCPWRALLILPVPSISMLAQAGPNGHLSMSHICQLLSLVLHGELKNAKPGTLHPVKQTLQSAKATVCPDV